MLAGPLVGSAVRSYKQGCVPSLPTVDRRPVTLSGKASFPQRMGQVTRRVN